MATKQARQASVVSEQATRRRYLSCGARVAGRPPGTTMGEQVQRTR